MKKYIFSIAGLTLWLTSLVEAAEINVRVETDKNMYNIGYAVSWTIYAWAGQNDNYGVAFLSINLDDAQGDILSPPFIDDPNGVMEFKDTDYGTSEKFLLFGPGTPSDNPPKLRDMLVMQSPADKQFDVGNDGDPNHIFAKGEFKVTSVGSHELTVSVNGANYWPDTTNNAVAFQNQNKFSATFSVYYAGDINRDGQVNAIDLYIMSQQWLMSPGVPSADIAPGEGDNFVDHFDFAVLALQWLK